MPSLHPGWLMTPAQHRLYFQLLARVCAAAHLTAPAEKEAQRQRLHRAAFGRDGVSARAINHTTGFDRFKAACLAELRPADLGAQLAQLDQPRRRLRHRILQYPHPYVLALLQSPRFKRASLADLESMSEPDLTALRNTLSARLKIKQPVAATGAAAVKSW